MRRHLVTALVALVLLGLMAPAVAAAEPGDDPGTALPVAAGTSTWDSTDMTAASPPDPAQCKDFPGPLFNTMWLRYTPAKSGTTMVDVNSFVSADGSTDFLAVVFVYAVSGGTQTLVDCGAYPATVFLNVQAGVTYLIMVAGLSTAATEEPDLSDRGGTFDVTITAIKGRVLTDHFRDSGEFLDDEFCPGGGVLVAWNDNVTFKTFLGANGPRRYTSFFQGVTTFTDVSDGQTLTVKYAQTFTDRLDGSGVITGLAQDVWLDGKRVVKDVGRLVFDLETGEVTFDAGRHPQWYEGLDFCAELGLGA